MGPRTVLILLASVHAVASLECYTCKDVVNVAGCNKTQMCQDGQVCFHNATKTSHGQQISLGCLEYQQCGAHGNIPNTIVGRDIHKRQTSNCLECCSTDQCNGVLCDHLKPKACVDDESIDCAKLNTLFSICTDIDHAKSVCPKFCDLCNVVDGNWSDWSAWSKCDVTCENGSQARSRTCSNPTPKYGGLDCVGKSVEVKQCHRDLCPVHGGWSKWAEWESCSVTCDMGLQRRTRNCSNPVPIRNGNHCFGHNLDVEQCMPGPCANGGWSSWNNWDSCSVTCGSGIHTKTRSCTNPHPSPYGKDCIGNDMKVESCATSDCVTNHCKSNPCLNGRCYELISDYLCVCDHGFEGQNCNLSASLCKPDPCVHGTCLDVLNDFSCRCDNGFEGRYCNTSNSACKSNPCLRGKCFDSKEGFICVCDDGYRGKQCNISVDYCLSSPCVRGTCVNNEANFTCVCPPGVTGRRCESVNATDCYDIQKLKLGNKNGIYTVKLLKSREYLDVLCDLETADGGWTIFQRRFDGSVDFHRNFANYAHGFGNVSGEFWLGLHNIYEMASQGQSELRIDLEAADGTTAYEVFPNFRVSLGPGYTLHIDQGFGTAGDSMSTDSGSNWSTTDHDADRWPSDNCAKYFWGGWWYNSCANDNLNGDYAQPGTQSTHGGGNGGMTYRSFKSFESLKSSKIMFRRV